MLNFHSADCGDCSGALEVLEKIQHPEGKIAGQLRLIAVQLYKASKVIAPNVGLPLVRYTNILTKCIEALLGTERCYLLRSSRYSYFHQGMAPDQHGRSRRA